MKWLAFPLFLIGFLAQAQVTQRNILSTTYSLSDIEKSTLSIDRFKPFPQSPEDWKRQVADSILVRLVNDGAKRLDFKFASVPLSAILAFKQQGNRSIYEGYSYVKRTSLIQLALVESKEGKGRFLNAVMEGLWSICEESYWGVPAHITETAGIPDVEVPRVELFTAETAATLRLVNYFLGAQLDQQSPLFRKRIHYESERSFFKPLQANKDTYPYMKKDVKVNNWNPWIMSNWIIATLFAESDQQKRSSMLYEAMQGVDKYLNGLGNDGGCDQGAHYWTAAGASAFDCLELLQKGTNGKVNVYPEPLIQKMLAYIYQVHIGKDYFVNVGDGEPSIENLSRSFLYRIGKAVGDRQMEQFASYVRDNYPLTFSLDSFHKFRSIQNILSFKALPEGKNNYRTLDYVWIYDVQLMSALTKNNLLLATHAGHNGESHNHNDVGDFVVYANNEPFIIDAGRGTYTARTFGAHRYELWNTQSNFHNLPIINGKGQSAGKEFTATDVIISNTAKETKLTMELSKAWSPEADNLQWKRTNSLLLDKEEVKITDEYVLKNAPDQLRQVFMTVAKVDTSKEGKLILIGEKAKLVLAYDASVFSVATDLPQTNGAEYGKIGKSWYGKTITRIVLTVKKPLSKATFQYTIKKS